MWPAPSWLDSSVGRALLQYRISELLPLPLPNLFFCFFLLSPHYSRGQNTENLSLLPSPTETLAMPAQASPRGVLLIQVSLYSLANFMILVTVYEQGFLKVSVEPQFFSKPFRNCIRISNMKDRV